MRHGLSFLGLQVSIHFPMCPFFCCRWENKDGNIPPFQYFNNILALVFNNTNIKIHFVKLGICILTDFKVAKVIFLTFSKWFWRWSVVQTLLLAFKSSSFYFFSARKVDNLSLKHASLALAGVGLSLDSQVKIWVMDRPFHWHSFAPATTVSCVRAQKKVIQNVSTVENLHL